MQSTRARVKSLIGILIVLGAAVTMAEVPADGSGAYATGKYRNLFAEEGHSKEEARAKIEKAYNQLFHGDPQTQAIAFAAGTNANGPLMYVTD